MQSGLVGAAAGDGASVGVDDVDQPAVGRAGRPCRPGLPRPTTRCASGVGSVLHRLARAGPVIVSGLAQPVLGDRLGQRLSDDSAASRNADRQHDAEVEQVDQPVERVAGAVLVPRARGVTVITDATSAVLVEPGSATRRTVGSAARRRRSAPPRRTRGRSSPGRRSGRGASESAERDRADQQAEHGDAEGDPQVVGQRRRRCRWPARRAPARAGSACPSGRAPGRRGPAAGCGRAGAGGRSRSRRAPWRSGSRRRGSACDLDEREQSVVHRLAPGDVTDGERRRRPVTLVDRRDEPPRSRPGAA